MKKLCTFSAPLADKIEQYREALGLRTFQAGVEVICAQYFNQQEQATRPRAEDEKA